MMTCSECGKWIFSRTSGVCKKCEDIIYKKWSMASGVFNDDSGRDSSPSYDSGRSDCGGGGIK